MALVLADRVLETTTTAGSGTITLAGAEPGYQSFSAVGDGNQTYYTIAGDTEWEVGIGTYTASGTTLSRDTVLSSSNSNAKVTFSAGTKKVFVTYPSEKSVNLDVSGNISLSSAVISGVGYPSADSDAATKLYVDTLAAEGISYHEPVKYEVPNTTGNLTATYNNGTAGVGATLTNAGTLTAFVPDGVTASISDRVLVYNQTNGFENGVYTVTVVGSGASSWVLTRATDANTYGVKSPTELGAGDAFYVTSGNTGAGETYVCNTPGTIVFGSTAISFVQISAAQVYSAGNGLSLTNTVFSLATPVAVGNGGTGSSATPTNGQLLIGNGSDFTLSTLTAGSGVSITNSAGSITLSATGLGGTVTAVTATGPLASSGGTTPDISIANSTGTGSVVLDQGATISSATITAGVSASITTITGSSANITTVTGTTAGFSSAAITQLSGTSAGITTVSGTTTTFSSGTITQFGATSATVTTISGTNVTYSNGNLTSATVTTISGTTATYTSATVTNLNVTSVTLSNLSVASANITTLTGTNLSYGSATITTGNLTFSSTGQRITGDFSNATVSNRLMFQTSTTNANTSVRAIPNGTATTANFAVHNGSDANNSSFLSMQAQPSDVLINSGITGTGTYLPMGFYTGGSERMRLDTSGNLGIGKTATTMLDVSGTITGINGAFTSANITTLTGTTFGTTGTTQLRANSLAISTTGAGINSVGDIYAVRTGGASGVIFFNTSNTRYLYWDGTTYSMIGAELDVNGQRVLNAGNYGTYVTSLANLSVTSANITTLTGTTFGTTATTQLRGASGQITTLTVTSANITTLTGTTFSDGAGNVRNIPSAGTTKTSAYTLATTDIGEFVTVGSGGSITVPNSTFSAGNAISIYNDTTGNISINISLTTCYVAGTNTNRSGVTLATRGVATILFISGTQGVISGNVT